MLLAVLGFSTLVSFMVLVMKKWATAFVVTHKGFFGQAHRLAEEVLLNGKLTPVPYRGFVV